MKQNLQGVIINTYRSDLQTAIGRSLAFKKVKIEMSKSEGRWSNRLECLFPLSLFVCFMRSIDRFGTLLEPMVSFLKNTLVSKKPNPIPRKTLEKLYARFSMFSSILRQCLQTLEQDFHTRAKWECLNSVDISNFKSPICYQIFQWFLKWKSKSSILRTCLKRTCKICLHRFPFPNKTFYSGK